MFQISALSQQKFKKNIVSCPCVHNLTFHNKKFYVSPICKYKTKIKKIKFLFNANCDKI